MDNTELSSKTRGELESLVRAVERYCLATDVYSSNKDVDKDLVRSFAYAERHVQKLRESETYIEMFSLTVRTYNILKGAGINTIEQLDRISFSDIVAITNMDSKSLRETLETLWRWQDDQAHARREEAFLS